MGGSLENDRFMKACRLKSTDATPVWFMRQAGRYLPEYRKIRKTNSMLSILKNPELSAEITAIPADKLGVDAAIIFTDIMAILYATNIEFDLKDNVGPVIRNPIRGLPQVKAIETKSVIDNVPFLSDSIKLSKNNIDVPLIGFSAAPFTLASYLIEGGSSGDFRSTKEFMYRNPTAWHSLMEKLGPLILEYLKMQIKSGVDAVQLFDSWAGCLDSYDYNTYVAKYTKGIFDGLKHYDVPTIHFGTNTSAILKDMMKAGGNVCSVDWRIGLDDAWSKIGRNTSIQGNLDPAALLGPKTYIKNKVLDIMKRANGRNGHIFNLGHGVLPETPVESIRYVVDIVHGFG